MGMVRSQKSIGGAVGVRLGNAPYKIGDRATATQCLRHRTTFLCKVPNHQGYPRQSSTAFYSSQLAHKSLLMD